MYNVFVLAASDEDRRRRPVQYFGELLVYNSVSVYPVLEYAVNVTWEERLITLHIVMA